MKFTKAIFLNIIAVISCLGMIAWIISDYFGGMIIIFLSYAVIIFPFLILYIISFFETIISTLKNGIKTNSIKVVSHSLVILTILISVIYNSELFKSKIILDATLKDDLYFYNLKFREDGTVNNEINGIFGYKENIKGKYFIKDNLIIFTKKPYSNNFIPDTLLIDQKQKAIFITKKNGEFETNKEWLNHFEINL